MQRTWRLMRNSPRLSEDKTVVRIMKVNKLQSLLLVIDYILTTNTVNNVASLQYNNSNRTDFAIAVGYCHYFGALGMTQR